MLKKSVSIALSLSVLFGACFQVSAQTLTPQALKIKAKVQKRAAEHSTTKVKLNSDVVYVGTLSEVGDTTFAVTDKSGSRHVVPYWEVKSVGDTSKGIGWRIGLGAAIGAGAVLTVLAIIIAKND